MNWRFSSQDAAKEEEEYQKLRIKSINNLDADFRAYVEHDMSDDELLKYLKGHTGDKLTLLMFVFKKFRELEDTKDGSKV